MEKKYDECIFIKKIFLYHFKIYHNLFFNSSDSWSDYKNYLKTSLKLYSEYQKTKNDILESNNTFENRVPIRIPITNNGKEYILWYDADYTPQMVLTFFNQLIKSSEENKKKLRGPYLAQLELYKRLEEESYDAEAIVGMDKISTKKYINLGFSFLILCSFG